MPLVECVPNFSEGHRPEIVRQIRDAIAAVSRVTILDVSSDTSHNRTVITFVAPVAPRPMRHSRASAQPGSLIDLTVAYAAPTPHRRD